MVSKNLNFTLIFYKVGCAFPMVLLSELRAGSKETTTSRKTHPTLRRTPTLIFHKFGCAFPMVILSELNEGSKETRIIRKTHTTLSSETSLIVIFAED